MDRIETNPGTEPTADVTLVKPSSRSAADSHHAKKTSTENDQITKQAGFGWVPPGKKQILEIQLSKTTKFKKLSETTYQIDRKGEFYRTLEHIVDGATTLTKQLLGIQDSSVDVKWQMVTLGDDSTPMVVIAARINGPQGKLKIEKARMAIASLLRDVVTKTTTDGEVATPHEVLLFIKEESKIIRFRAGTKKLKFPFRVILGSLAMECSGKICGLTRAEMPPLKPNIHVIGQVVTMLTRIPRVGIEPCEAGAMVFANFSLDKHLAPLKSHLGEDHVIHAVMDEQDGEEGKAPVLHLREFEVVPQLDLRKPET